MRESGDQSPEPGGSGAEGSRVAGLAVAAHPTSMEFLNFLIILTAGWLVWRRPERERLAFVLLIVSCMLVAFLFLVGTHTSFVPRVNL